MQNWRVNITQYTHPDHSGESVSFSFETGIRIYSGPDALILDNAWVEMWIPTLEDSRRRFRNKRGIWVQIRSLRRVTEDERLPTSFLLQSSFLICEHDHRIHFPRTLVIDDSGIDQGSAMIHVNPV